MLVIKPWSNNYEYYSETRVPLHVASAWAVIGSKYLLVLSANGDLCRFVHTYWIITPLPSAFANAPGKQVTNKEVEIWDQSPSYAAFAAIPCSILSIARTV